MLNKTIRRQPTFIDLHLQNYEIETHKTVPKNTKIYFESNSRRKNHSIYIKLLLMMIYWFTVLPAEGEIEKVILRKKNQFRQFGIRKLILID